jgi:hypothetical protein
MREISRELIDGNPEICLGQQLWKKQKVAVDVRFLFA